MRKGVNPTKGGKLISKAECHHRIIIPVHIPNEEGYFKDAYKIFELCLFSLIKSSSFFSNVSVISNKCSDEVNERLLSLYRQNYIEELIIEKEGIGKINSILKALRTVDERLITITDADVLFLNGWDENIFEVFKSVPQAGSVCPVPVYRKHFQMTSNIWLKYFFSNRVFFERVKNPEAMTKFANSIGWPWLDEKYKDVIGVLKSKNGNLSVLGCSHFVATYKKEVFEYLPQENSIYLVDGDSEFKYTDEPVLKANGFRLSTYDNYAYHLGNVLEDWMLEEFNQVTEVKEKEQPEIGQIKIIKKGLINPSLKETFFKKIISFKTIQKYLLKSKGLTKEQIKNFTS